MPTTALIAGLGSLAGGVISAVGQTNASTTAANAYLSAAQLAATGYQQAGDISSAAATTAASQQAWGAATAAGAQRYGATRALGTEQMGATQALGAESSAANAAIAGFQPYMSTGAGATYSLAELYGLPTPSNPQGGQPLSDASLQAFSASPDYQFALQQGIQAANASAAAQGGALSGGAAKELATFGSGLASQQFGNYFQRLLSLSQMGQQAAGSVANINEQLGTQQAATDTNLASQQATTQLAKSDAIARGITGSANATAAGTLGAAGAEAVGLTGATSAYANAQQQAANITAAGTAGAYSDISTGVTNAFNNASFNNYLANMGPSASAYGSTGSAGGGGTPSDIRLKRDIHKLGRTPHGIGLYRYRYLWSDEIYVGVMAQEVEQVAPDAVMRDLDGYLSVDYGRLGMRHMTLGEWRDEQR